ncbi:hypothetical protein DNK65_04515 [Citrobacter koseri]|nr:hypothetical protein EGX86_10235 [Citrobacter koseri]PYZ77576.1 hypothetical protein DNK65_04515 [Citrobacter koseri]
MRRCGFGSAARCDCCAVGRPDKRSAIRQKCRMAAQAPYPAYGMVLLVGRICILRCRVGINLMHRFDLRQHLFA